MARTTQQKFIAALEGLASAHDGLEAVTNSNHSNGVEYVTIRFQPEDGFDTVLQVSVWWGHHSQNIVRTNNTPPPYLDFPYTRYPNLLTREGGFGGCVAAVKAELGEALTEKVGAAS